MTFDNAGKNRRAMAQEALRQGQEQLLHSEDARLTASTKLANRGGDIDRGFLDDRGRPRTRPERFPGTPTSRTCWSSATTAPDSNDGARLEVLRQRHLRSWT